MRKFVYTFILYSLLAISLVVSLFGFASSVDTKINIKLTEVYFAGTDEWLELYNNTASAFSGDLVISGVKSSNLYLDSVYISAYSTVLIGDKLSMIQNTSDSITGQGLSIIDAKDINISVLYSGQIVDNIQMSNSEMNYIKSQKASIQKMLINDAFIITGGFVSSPYNVESGYWANPGKIVAVDYSGSINTGTNNIDTGSTQTGTNTSGFFLTGLVCEGTGLYISEIFAGDENYTEFIEIKTKTDFDEYIMLTGTALKQTVNIFLKANSGQNLIISASKNERVSTTMVIENTALELVKSGGYILVSRQSGQVMDIVNVPSLQQGKSYYQPQNYNCLRNMDYVDRFTPGLDIDVLKYFPPAQIVVEEKIVEKIVEVEVEKIIYTGSICITGDIQETGNVIETGDLNIGETSTGISVEPINIVIIDVNYDPPGSDYHNETVTVRSDDDRDIDLSKLRIHSMNSSSKNRIYGILKAGETKILTGSFTFPNTKPNCVELLSGDIQIDKYCYTPEDKKETTQTDNNTVETDNTIDAIDYSRYQIEILDIDYDPEGLDKNNEKIKLHLIKGANIVDLSDKFYLRRGTTTKSLRKYGMLTLGTPNILQGTFGFPNRKDTCVQLIHKGKTQVQVYDEFCYAIPLKQDPTEPTVDKSKQLEESHIKQIASWIQGQIKIVSILPNPVGNDKDKEQIQLKRSSNTGVYIDLSSGFFLQIGTRKRYFKSGVLLANEIMTIIDNFAFPNKLACVAIGQKIGKDIKVYDKMCYDKPASGDKFVEKNGQLEKVSDMDLSILKDIKLKQIGDKVCALFQNKKIDCKTNIIRKVRKTSNYKIYKAYVDFLHSYLTHNWKIFYYNTDIYKYRKTLYKAKQYIDDGIDTINIDGQQLSVYDIELMYDVWYSASPLENILNHISKFIPSKLIGDYQKMIDKYI